MSDARYARRWFVAVLALVVMLGTAACGARADLDEAPATNQFVNPAMVPAAYRQAPLQAAAAPVREIDYGPGRWTPQIGVQIAKRALQWVGWPYSFGAGNEHGPTYGTPVDHASRHDGKIRGFDCSGLVLYAMAPWLKGMTHFAASQYLEAGGVHPSLNSLMPGDLIFWSEDGTIGGVGHVAIYLGKGYVVQAPQSGDRVRVTPINQVEPGTIGTTRPLTHAG